MAIDESLVNSDVQESNINSLEKSKFGVDGLGYVYVRNLGLADLLSAASLLIKGTLPEVNFNRIIKTASSGASYALAFIYNGSVQFYFDVTNATSDYDLSIRTKNGITLASGIDALLLESGDSLLKES